MSFLTEYCKFVVAYAYLGLHRLTEVLRGTSLKGHMQRTIFRMKGVASFWCFDYLNLPHKLHTCKRPLRILLILSEVIFVLSISIVSHVYLADTGNCALFEDLRGSVCPAVAAEATEWRRSLGRHRMVHIDANWIEFDRDRLSANRETLLNRQYLHTFWTDCSVRLLLSEQYSSLLLPEQYSSLNWSSLTGKLAFQCDRTRYNRFFF